MSAIYVGDVGTEIEVDCGVDISGATSTKISVRKPDGSEVEWSATPKGTTKLSKICAIGDLDQVGVYLIQAVVATPSWNGRGQTAQFSVLQKFEGLS